MDNFQIETAQNVNISQQTAAVGQRIIAFVIDACILAVYILIVTFVFSNLEMLDEFNIVVGATIGFPLFFYHLIWENVWNGQSPGKAALQLRVVNLDGTKPTFSNFLIRWVLRIIDISISSGAVALFSILLNGKGQRLGDMAAKTTVITERTSMSLSRTLLEDVEEDYLPKYPQVTVFNDRDIQTIKNVLQDARNNANHIVIIKLANKVSSVMDITFTEKPIDFLKRVLKDYNFYTQQ